MNTTSAVVLFSLSGINATASFRDTLFSLTLLCYCLILLINVALILTIVLHQSLHEPMYIILCNLCINALYGTGGFYPKFIYDLLSNSHVIPYAGCLLQIYVIYSYAMIDYCILVLMAYDRYVAICRPLAYHSVMTVQRTFALVCLCWLVPLWCMLVLVGLTSALTLCGSHIDKLYCENWSIVKLSCGSTKANDIVGLIIVYFYVVHILYIACSYVQLIKSALNSKEGRGKFMQTCVPHLICLFNVTTALLFDLMYTRYGSPSVPQSLRNFMAVQFLIFPPILNPVIYGLILTKIRRTLIHFCAVVYRGFKLRSTV
ncbi:olfactory receptor 52J3-like [Fundulus heteroclitus]|uniref:olfactory receptor 52J3-like n=1 Tax=Fundulus heteroclitus TaxID=8078 RepID=UPI00165BD342|nr:olfactory receptor 52J3-like [Fundulus heteroclitus]